MKWLLTLLIMVLASYAPLELTRVIIAGGMHYYPTMFRSFVLEVACIWVLYLMIVPTMWFWVHKVNERAR